jgi:hypothetical protein
VLGCFSRAARIVATIVARSAGVSAASTSVQAVALPVIPNEDKADILGAWRDVVHPRRHDMIAMEPAHDSGEGAGLTTMESQRVFTRAAGTRQSHEVRLWPAMS